jgi:hypothetical protein
MHLTSTFHPPARIDPLVFVVNDMPWSFLVATGALLLAAFAYGWHNIMAPRSRKRVVRRHGGGEVSQSFGLREANSGGRRASLAAPSQPDFAALNPATDQPRAAFNAAECRPSR